MSDCKTLEAMPAGESVPGGVAQAGQVNGKRPDEEKYTGPTCSICSSCYLLVKSKK